MTQAELAALPEDGGDLGLVEEVIDGKVIRRPVMPPFRALYQGPDDIMLIQDAQGTFWTTGWADGVLYKRRMRG